MNDASRTQGLGDLYRRGRLLALWFLIGLLHQSYWAHRAAGGGAGLLRVRVWPAGSASPSPPIRVDAEST